MIGSVIGNFRVVGQLGKGGMGEVFVAEHVGIQTRVAIKVLLPEISRHADHVHRLFNEARIVSRIKHAGIAKIFDVGFHDRQAYLVMELLEGESLAQRIGRRGALPTAELADIGRQVASVLAATHTAGITHRDLKPDNIFLVGDDELERGERVKILDFGIAKLPGAGGPHTIGTMGTPEYMAPEQWGDSSRVDWRADAYSLGCVLYEMVTGRPPFPSTTIADAYRQHTQDAPVPARVASPQLPADVDAVISRLLAKDPAARANASIAEVARALEPWCAASPRAGSEGWIAHAATVPRLVAHPRAASEPGWAAHPRAASEPGLAALDGPHAHAAVHPNAVLETDRATRALVPNEPGDPVDPAPAAHPRAEPGWHAHTPSEQARASEPGATSEQGWHPIVASDPRSVASDDGFDLGRAARAGSSGPGWVRAPSTLGGGAGELVRSPARARRIGFIGAAFAVVAAATIASVLVIRRDRSVEPANAAPIEAGHAAHPVRTPPAVERSSAASATADPPPTIDPRAVMETSPAQTTEPANPTVASTTQAGPPAASPARAVRGRKPARPAKPATTSAPASTGAPPTNAPANPAPSATKPATPTTPPAATTPTPAPTNELEGRT